MDRAVLERLISVGFTLLGLAFAYALFLGLSPTSDSRNASKDPFEQIGFGKTVKLRLSGARVWASRLSDEQRNQLGRDSRCAEQEICVVSAVGQSDVIDIVYSAQTPPQLTRDEEWLGGFVDPTTGVVYKLDGVALLPSDANPLETYSD